MIKAYLATTDGKAFLYLNNGKRGFVPIYVVSQLWETHVVDVDGIILHDDDINRIINYLQHSLGDDDDTQA